MHTYRKAEGGGWQAGYQRSDQFDPLGPVCDFEWEAAAFAAFLNGGRYSPDEISRLLAVPLDDEEDDASIHPDRPKSFDDDYPLERKRPFEKSSG